MGLVQLIDIAAALYRKTIDSVAFLPFHRCKISSNRCFLAIVFRCTNPTGWPTAVQGENLVYLRAHLLA